jgi:hypothetical protein
MRLQTRRNKALKRTRPSLFGCNRSASVSQFVEIVCPATTDEGIADHLWPAATRSTQALSARLRRLTVADVPSDLRLQFERLYDADLPADRYVFDIFDADDARAFPHQCNHQKA